MTGYSRLPIQTRSSWSFSSALQPMALWPDVAGIGLVPKGSTCQSVRPAVQQRYPIHFQRLDRD